MSQLNLTSLDHVFKSLLGFEQTHFGDLVPLGMQLLGAAIVLEVFAVVLTYWIKGGLQDLIAKLVMVVAITSIPMAAFASWPKLPNNLVTFFTNDVTAALMHTDSSSASTQMTAIITRLVEGANSIVITKPPGEPSVAGFVADMFGADKFLPALQTVVIQALLFFPLIFFQIATIFALNGPLFMMNLGVIFGPVLIAWLPWSPMSNLATTWLKYMLSLLMSYAVGIAMVAIVASAMQNVRMSVTGAYSFDAAITGLIPLICTLLLVGYFMLKVETIGGAMVGGPHLGHGAAALFAGAAAAKALSGANKGGNKGGSSGNGSGGPPGPSGGSTPGGSSGGGAGQPGGGSGGGAALSANAGAASGSAGGAAGGSAAPGGGGAAAPATGGAMAGAAGSQSAGGAGGSGQSGGGGAGSRLRSMAGKGVAAVAKGAAAVASHPLGKGAIYSVAGVTGGPAALGVAALAMSRPGRAAASKVSGSAKAMAGHAKVALAGARATATRPVAAGAATSTGPKAAPISRSEPSMVSPASSLRARSPAQQATMESLRQS